MAADPKPTTPPDMPPLPPMRPLPGPPTGPTVFPTQTLAVADPLCGHLPGEQHTAECAYWHYVAAGELPPPPGMEELVAAIRRPLVTPAPVVDPALREVA